MQVFMRMMISSIINGSDTIQNESWEDYALVNPLPRNIIIWDIPMISIIMMILVDDLHSIKNTYCIYTSRR